MTAPWLAERRTPSPNPTAGITYDNMAPTKADDAELKRALRAENLRYQEAWLDGLESRPDPDPSDDMLHAAWQAGRWERNRRRQDAVLRFLGSTRVARQTTKRVRRWKKRLR